jgi:tRNA A37 methylthiotransferase MiaB
MAKKVLRGMVGRTVRVLCEEYSNGFVFGKDEHGLNVKFSGKEDLTGNFADVIIKSAGDILTGEMIK